MTDRDVTALQADNVQLQARVRALEIEVAELRAVQEGAPIPEGTPGDLYAWIGIDEWARPPVVDVKKRTPACCLVPRDLVPLVSTQRAAIDTEPARVAMQLQVTETGGVVRLARYHLAAFLGEVRPRVAEGGGEDDA